jgi:hypothetical protein
LLKRLSQAGFSVIAPDLITIGRVVEQSGSILTTTAIAIFQARWSPGGLCFASHDAAAGVS